MSNFSKEIIYQIHEYQRDIGDICSCDNCGKYVPSDEYIVNSGLCDDCMDDNMDEYLREVIGIENPDELTNEEIELKIDEHYKKFEVK